MQSIQMADDLREAIVKNGFRVWIGLGVAMSLLSMVWEIMFIYPWIGDLGVVFVIIAEGIKAASLMFLNDDGDQDESEGEEASTSFLRFLKYF